MEKTVISNYELEVLRTLNSKRADSQETQTSEIAEIATVTGMGSKDEVQRALFILEGRALVQPEPAGDLTSSQWKITDVGVEALDYLAVGQN